MLETLSKIIKWLYSIMHAIKNEYTSIGRHIFISFFKSKHPKITIAEINVITGLSATKILNAARETEYKIDWIKVILRWHFFEQLNIENANNPLTKYRIISTISSSKKNHYLYKFIRTIIKEKIKKRYTNQKNSDLCIFSYDIEQFFSTNYPSRLRCDRNRCRDLYLLNLRGCLWML